jgi:electron transport complex protein RnfD
MTDFLRANEAGSLVNSSLAAVFASALILMAWKLIVIEIPLLYLAVLAIGEGFQTSHLFMGWHMLYPIYFFVAFFIITDLVTTPTTRQGQRLFAVVAALLCLFFRHMTSDLPAIVYSVLLANAVVPWIDEWFRPQNSRRHHPWAEVAEGLKSQVRTAKHL